MAPVSSSLGVLSGYLQCQGPRNTPGKSGRKHIQQTFFFFFGTTTTVVDQDLSVPLLGLASSDLLITHSRIVSMGLRMGAHGPNRNADVFGCSRLKRCKKILIIIDPEGIPDEWMPSIKKS